MLTSANATPQRGTFDCARRPIDDRRQLLTDDRDGYHADTSRSEGHVA
jgi:hypothetical protein